MFQNLGLIVDKVHNWGKPSIASDIKPTTEKIVEILLDVPGMILTNPKYFNEAVPIFKLKEGNLLKLYKNLVGVDHVFLADNSGKMVFGGYVLWHHSEGLKLAIKRIKTEFK